jgi:hypothetical protein
MTTRSNNEAHILDPLPNPEALFRAANAEERQRKAQIKSLQQANSEALHLASAVPLPIDTPPTDPVSTPPYRLTMNESSSSTNQPLSAQELLMQLMAVQETSIKLAQADREAAAEDCRAAAAHIERLENAVMKLTIKEGTSERPPSSVSDRIDLQRFKISDGPSFKGPFQAVEPFLKWIHGIQIFFATKAVTNDIDKIRIVGGLIAETNLLSFYANEAESFVDKPWSAFKDRLFEVALPTEWRTTLRMKIRQLKMFDNETFITFSTRARTLQSMFNFDKKDMDDFELAEYVTFAVPEELRVKVNNFGILRVKPFIYSKFEKRAATFYEVIAKKPGNRNRPQSSVSQQNERPTRDEIVWRINAYLDTQGRCHYCKKKCGSAPGTCPHALDRAFVEIPASFKAPPMPEGWKPLGRRNNSPPTTAGKPTQAPAGRPPTKAASVAGVAESNLFPSLDAASVSALAALDEELRLHAEERYVKPPTPKRLIIELVHQGKHLRGLVDTGAEINLMTEQAAKGENLLTYKSAKPTTITLALENNSSKPLILRLATTATLSDPNSKLTFENVPFRLGPIAGPYDMILGTPFLSFFSLSVSMSRQSLRCDRSGHTISDFRKTMEQHDNEIQIATISSSPELPNYPCEQSEKRILEEFRDLFPIDIPAVSEAAETEGLFTNGSFPEKIQSESSKV